MRRVGRRRWRVRREAGVHIADEAVVNGGFDVVEDYGLFGGGCHVDVVVVVVDVCRFDGQWLSCHMPMPKDGMRQN